MAPSTEPEANPAPSESGTSPAAPGASSAPAAAPAASDAPSGTAAAGEGGVATTTPAEQTPPSSPSEATPAPVAKPRDWRDDRIAKLTAQLKEAKSQAGAKSEGASAPVASAAPAMAESEIERRVSELAAQHAQLNAFNQACSSVASQGKAQFSDFDSKINELKQLAGDGDLQQQMTYNSFIAAAIETGEAPRLLYELGADLNEAARIMALPPLKMAVELTKRAVAKPLAGDLTKTPKPITPVGGQRASHSAIAPDDPDRADNLSTAEWMKRRGAQAEEARKRN